MPNRILREGINSSERIESLSAGAELFYRRVMSIVDDFGRFSGNLTLIRSAAWPLAPEKHTNAEMNRWLKEARDVGLLITYEVAGKPYFELTDFRQRTRTPKYPAPPPEVLASHERAFGAHVARKPRAQSEAYSESESEAYSESNTNAESESAAEPQKPEPPARTLQVLPKIESEPTFIRFKGLAIDYGMQVSEVEWRDFERFTWANLDWTQKHGCITGLEKRIAAQDYGLRDTTPENYAKKRYYERRIREPPPERKSYIDNIQEQMAAHRERKRKMLEGNP
jgi:hypothetical protein